MKKIIVEIFAIALVVSLSAQTCKRPLVGTASYQFTSSTAPEGAIGNKGVFSVADTLQVYFAKGNLVYNSGTWSLAPDQLTYGSYLLYGSSGAHYKPEGDREYAGAVDISQTDDDWGWYNPITNAGNQPHLWYTPTLAHWTYLIQGRPDAEQKYGYAMVGSIKGVVILPDLWTQPAGTSFTPGMGQSNNRYSNEQWAAMEAEGAMFLSFAGNTRTSASVLHPGMWGAYRSGTHYDATTSYFLRFNGNEMNPIMYNPNDMGFSVRLIQDKK